MKTENTTIRAYEAADVEGLSRIWLAASSEVHAFIGEDRLREQQTLVETVYLPRAETWVAMRDGEQAGFISLMEDFIGGCSCLHAIRATASGACSSRMRWP